MFFYFICKRKQWFIGKQYSKTCESGTQILYCAPPCPVASMCSLFRHFSVLLS